MSLDEIILRFAARKAGSAWQARCPAHADRNPSLSISERDGKILINCHAGCTVESVCAAVGIELSDLFVSSNGANAEPSREVTAYCYTDENGQPLYWNVRYTPKSFRWRRKSDGGWIYNLDGVRRVPYNLRQIHEFQFVLICEGEKDCDNAEHCLDLTATNSKHWKPEFAEFLNGKDVAVIVDADEPGRKTAIDVATTLFGKTKSLKVVELPGSKDLSDWIDAGGTRTILLGFIESAPAWTPQSPTDGWRDEFHSFDEFEAAPPLSFSIDRFLQNEGITAIAGLSGHGKTWVALSIARALLLHNEKLWGLFEVREHSDRLIYLIPESTIGAFKHRVKLMGLYEEIRTGRLLVRTLSKGPAPLLSDPKILRAAQDAHVVLDTAVRFLGESDEGSSSDIASGLSADLLGLLAAGARSVTPLFHSPKNFAKETSMSLEGMIRGSGELGAVLATAWGIRQISLSSNIVHIQNLKPRDFEPCGPFQLIGRPDINDTGDFNLYSKPGECGQLAEYLELGRNRGGASQAERESKASQMELVRQYLEAEPGLSDNQIVAKLKSAGINLSRTTVLRYRRELHAL